MKQLQRSTWIGWIWTIITGTLLHFVYAWSGENRVVGLYAPVNESSWEHLKLLFFPVLAYTIWEYCWIGRRWRGYILARAEGAWIGMLTILGLFYTYSGILGFHCLTLDILTFIAGASAAAYFTKKRITRESGSNRLGICILVLTAIGFGIFSLSPPQFGMFLPPASR